MPRERVIRWAIAVGIAVGAFAVVWWIAEGPGGMDRSAALTLATAAGPLFGGPFVWWAAQPISAVRSPPSARPRPAAAAPPHGTPASGSGGYAFICYSHDDAAAYVERLAARLTAEGVPVWFDREIISGARWARMIRQSIEECAVLVAVMTPAADASEWVEREIAHAQARGKPIFPLLVAGTPFFGLANLHYEDVTAGGLPSRRFVSGLRDLTAGALPPPGPAGTEPAGTEPATPDVASERATSEPSSTERAALEAAGPEPATTPEPAEPAFTVRNAPPPRTPPSPPPPHPRRRLPLSRPWLAGIAAAAIVVAAVAVYLRDGFDGDSGAASSEGYAIEATEPALAISPDGRRLYVTIDRVRSGTDAPERLQGQLAVIDTRSRDVLGKPMSINKGPGDAIVSPEGKNDRLYVESRTDDFDGVAVILNLRPTPTGINGIALDSTSTAKPSATATPTATSPATGQRRPMALDPHTGRLYVADPRGPALVVLDPKSGKPTGDPVPLPGPAADVALRPDGKRAFVTDTAHGTVVVIDTATRTQRGDPISAGDEPARLALSPDGRRLYVSHADSADIAVVDTRTNATVDGTLSGCSPPGDLAVVDHTLYVACRDSNVVTVLDTVERNVRNRNLVVGDRPAALVASPDGDRLYVASTPASGDVRVAVIDTAENAVLGDTLAGTWWERGSPASSPTPG